MKNNPGFTLIELMVVIVILGILAAVITPRIPSFVIKAKEGATKGNLATLRSTINIYYSDNDGVFPSDKLDCLVPKYLKQIPNCSIPPYHAASNAVFNGIAGVIFDEGLWRYDNAAADSGYGRVWIECTHHDLSGNAWSDY